MGYDKAITRTGLAGIIPVDYAHEIIEALPGANPIMQLAHREPDLATGQRTRPMAGTQPEAYFVTKGGGLKQTTDMDWTDKNLTAEEIACIVPIPQDAIDDASYDIIGENKPKIIQAFGKTIFRAVVHGTNIPAAWTTDLGGAGIVAVATAAGNTASIAAFTDLYEAILGETEAGTNGQLMLLEADGFIATGHVAQVSMRGKLRNCRDSDGNPIFSRSMQDATRYELDGAPIYFPTDGGMASSDTALSIAGQWDQLRYAVRQDMTWEVFREGVITDAAGAVVINLMQQDMVALRCVMRIGFALPNPPTALNTTDATRCPFSVLTA